MGVEVGSSAARRRELARRGDGTFGQQAYRRADAVDLSVGAPRARASGEEALQGFDEAWYDADADETVLEASTQVSVSDALGVDEGDPLYAEGRALLTEFLEERYPALATQWEGDALAVECTTRLAGERDPVEAARALADDPAGGPGWRSEAPGRGGEAALRDEFRSWARGCVIADLEERPDPGVEQSDQAVDSGTDALSDRNARRAAREFSVDGVEIARLAERGIASAERLEEELSLCADAGRGSGRRAELLRQWVASNRAELQRRWNIP